MLVYEEPDPGFFVSVGKTQSRRFILIQSHDHETSEVRFIPADQPDAEPTLVATRETAIEYSVDEAHGQFFILTNAGDAKDFRIVTAPVESPGRENWTDIVPHVPGRLILSHDVTARHLVRLERFEGLPRIVVRRLADGDEHIIAFDEEAYSLGLGRRLRVRHRHAPLHLFVDGDAGARLRLRHGDARAGACGRSRRCPPATIPPLYVTRRIMAPARGRRDGPDLASSIGKRHQARRLGAAASSTATAPTASAIPASFSVTRLSLVDRGFVYAIAHVRGGKDKGFAWYEAGTARGEGKHFYRFHRRGRASRRASVTRRAERSSRRAGRPAAC